MSRIIRKARPTDMAEIIQVMVAAKGIMRQSGNMNQWRDGYPSEAVITADLERNGGFVVEDDGMVVSYFAFLQSPEPTYSIIYAAQHPEARFHLLWHHLSAVRRRKICLSKDGQSLK